MPAPDKWSDADVEYLIKYFGRRSIKLMMYELGKSRYSIGLKTVELGLNKPVEKPIENKVIATGGRLTVDGFRTIHRMI